MKNELTTKQTFDYLQSVKELETLKIMQVNAKLLMREKINKCQAVINTRDQSYVEACRAEYTGRGSFFERTSGWLLLAGLFGGILGLIQAVDSTNHSFFGALFLDFGTLLFGTLVGVGIAVGIVWVIDAIVGVAHQAKETARIEEQYIRNQARAEQKNEEIQRSNRALEKRRMDARKQISLYNMQISQIDSDSAKIKSLLEKYYSCNIIYPKFRNNLSYICRLVEYFESGMCESLTGPNGGYILLDRDIKFGVVCEKLDNISNKLDEIYKEQLTLYNAIERCTRSVQDLGDKMDGLAGHIIQHDAKIENEIQNIGYNVQIGNEYSRISANYVMNWEIWNR